MIHKTISYRRDQRERHIAKRKRICHFMASHPLIEVAPGRYRSDFSKEIPMEWYSKDGKYAKGKIHCGCPLCKPGRGYRPSDKQERTEKAMLAKEREFLFGGKEADYDEE